jgi:hypothetical protein
MTQAGRPNRPPGLRGARSPPSAKIKLISQEECDETREKSALCRAHHFDPVVGGDGSDAAAGQRPAQPGSDCRHGRHPGGPTGLFTIYDGDTLRKGEFTFSVAYSNYDRDPGDVDISVIPLSFNIGINDHLELFYSTEGYRGVKVNNPRHLSSFYAAELAALLRRDAARERPGHHHGPGRASRLDALTTLPAALPPGVQPAVRAVPVRRGHRPELRPDGQPHRAGLHEPLGRRDGRQSNFGAASNFPGIGSVRLDPARRRLTTRTIPANLTFNTLTVPDLFTICPTYIADAPFINRLYGESSFGTHHGGAKIRLTGPNNPLGVGLVAFWRFYLITRTTSRASTSCSAARAPAATSATSASARSSRAA